MLTRKKNGQVPRWNAGVHTLFLRKRRVKHYKLAAPNQEPVLAAFEAAGWPPSIEFRFPHGQRGNGKIRLRNTIHDLNRSVRRLTPAPKFAP